MKKSLRIFKYLKQLITNAYTVMRSTENIGLLSQPEEVEMEVVTDYVTGLQILRKNAHRYIKTLATGKTEDSYKITRYRYTKSSKPGVPGRDKYGRLWEFATQQDALNAGFIPGKRSHTYFEPEVVKSNTSEIYQAHGNWYAELLERSPASSANTLYRDMGSFSPTYLTMEGLHYSYGVEFEVSRGFLPMYEAADFNISCERDGSITRDEQLPEGVRDSRGWAEYITGPLVGDAGMMHLQKLCRALSAKCGVNRSCGIHVHVGGFKFTDDFVVGAYLLGFLVEKSLFGILPASRHAGGHCNRIEKLQLQSVSHYSGNWKIMMTDYYNAIFSRISHTGGNPTNRWNKNTNHPRGAKCGYDHSSPRYWWLNLVPTIFKTRGREADKTIEFRCHSATLNYVKLKHWIKICMAFCKYVKDNTPVIIKRYENKQFYTLEEIVEYAYPKTSKKLVEYIISRRELFAENDSKTERSDYEEINSGELKTLKQITT